MNIEERNQIVTENYGKINQLINNVLKRKMFKVIHDEDREDYLQECWIKYIQLLDKNNPNVNNVGFLCTTFKNRIIDILRSKRVRRDFESNNTFELEYISDKPLVVYPNKSITTRYVPIELE